MKLLDASAAKDLADVAFVLCDLDDTLTLDGVLPAASYAALEDWPEGAAGRSSSRAGRRAGAI